MFAALHRLVLWCREHGVLLARPTRLWQARPLLIVGTMASGTQQMAKELAALGLNIGHESSSADGGTISWLHGLRLLDDPLGADVRHLCARPEAGAWHPMMLEPGHCPADGQVGGWGRCWKESCPLVVRRQYGCDLRAEDERRCVPQFGATLLQVRHPLRTIASCVRGFCRGDAASDAAGARLLGTARALLPSAPWAEVRSCGGQFALLWARYHAAVRSRVRAWYRVEDTRPCAVLRLAGLLDVSSAARESPALRAACAGALDRADGAADGAPGASGARAHGYHGRHNLDGFSLSYDDIEMLAGAQVRRQVEALAAEFGYGSTDEAGAHGGPS
ncbi:hypothetical protein KFE25_011351 [Diacronema lutheri]|uniref:Sulfotransferase n=1 Tax=Diacronema lutheri TaxID=2081491 RepID=A0A8J5X882_DIALT|nr:hypothetical protein KFE25_011351 [Diacronema lutheri]